MTRHALVAVAVALAVVAGGLWFVGGSLPGGTPGEVDATPAPDSTLTSDTAETEAGTAVESGTGDAGGTGEPTGSDYTFSIERIERCGGTCRDVTARLSNAGRETRRNVSVVTKVLADGDLLWSGNESVGTLAPGESHTSTRRVEVGFAGGLKIRANDGYVAIVTVVRSDAGTARFEDRRKVA